MAKQWWEAAPLAQEQRDEWWKNAPLAQEQPDEWWKAASIVKKPEQPVAAPYETTLSPEEQATGVGVGTFYPSTSKSKLATGEEFVKGAKVAAFSSLPSMWEGSKITADIGALSTVQKRLDLFNKIDQGEIKDYDQLRGLDLSTSQARSYLASNPETRQKLRGRLDKELGNRKEFVNASLKTIAEYQQYALENKGRVQDLTDVEGMTDFANWLGYNVGSGVVQLAPLMATAAITGGAGVLALGSAMGVSEAVANRLEAVQKKNADKPLTEQADAVIEYLQKTGDVNLVVGIASGALDMVLGPVARVLKARSGDLIKEMTRKGAVKAAVKDIPKQVGEEFVTGGAQEALQIAGGVRLGEEEEFFTKDNLKKIINSAAAEAAGGLGGAGINVGVAAVASPKAKDPVADAALRNLDDLVNDEDQRNTIYTTADPGTPDGALKISQALMAELGRRPTVDELGSKLAEILTQRQTSEPSFPMDSVNGRETYAERLTTFTDAELNAELQQNLLLNSTQPGQADVANNIAAVQAELQSRGVPPTTTAQGAQDVGQPISTAGGAGVSVADESGRREPTGGLGFLEPSGVVPTRQNVAGDTTGEGAQPPAITPGQTATAEEARLKTATDAELQDALTRIGGSDISLLDVPTIQAEINRRKLEKEQKLPPFQAKPFDTPPLLTYVPSDSTAGKFYNELLAGPDTFGKTTLEGVNNAIALVDERLANWQHPAITGATDADKRIGKANATAEERELLDAKSSLAGLGARMLNQVMAVEKGYKGKKGSSQEKINETDKQLETVFLRSLELLNKFNLLTAEETAEFAKLQTKATQPQVIEPTASETPPAPAEPTPYFGSPEINALGDKIRDTANQLAADFMVGDSVRFGNIPGNIVGLEGDYVRFRPVNAASPKAYQRVPKQNVTLVARPDTTSTSAASKSADQNKKFGSEQGKLNADMGGLIQLLGANMYASSIGEVSVKELLQNAFDAVKGAVSNKKAPSLYKVGTVTIEVNGDNRTITVTDDARGMTPEIVRDAFFTVAGSDKSDLDPSERSGGLGLAKMGFMLGAERLILNTVRDGVRVVVDTTATDIANSNFKIVKTPAPKNEHGTSVTVKIPEYYVDPKTGDKKDIYFSGLAKYFTVLEKPLIGPVQVIVKDSYGDTETLPVGVNFPAQDYQQFKVNFSWGSADIYFGKDRVESEYSIKHQVLSSGVYQFNGTGDSSRFKLSRTEAIPYNIIVNIKPNVDAKHPDYPFENSRERFKARLNEDVASMVEYLAQIARGHEAADLKENFKNIVSMPRVELGADVADASKKLRKAFDKRDAGTETHELPPLPKEVRVEGLKVIDTDTGKTLADRAKKEEKTTKGSFTADTAAPTREDFMVDMSQDPSKPIFHNNTNVDLIEVGKPYGDPEMFFAEVGTLLVEMKEAIANSTLYGYDVLSPKNLFFAGVAIDKKYGGLHLKVPYKALFVNPFYDFGAKSLFGMRQQLLNTMIHEIAHTGNMEHGVGHNSEMIRVELYLADQGLYDYFRDAILDVLVRHESTFTAMREAYGKSTTKNTAKSLEDYGKKSAAASAGGDGSSGSDQLGPVSTGERQGGDEPVRLASSTDTTSEVGAGVRGASPVGWKFAEAGPPPKSGLHPTVAESIFNNDITGALRNLARNTSGFFSDLATRLASLQLPTNIAFDNDRNLVRSAIDRTTKPQQTRLFEYVKAFYPQLYSKYFEGYDNAANLERVYDGLVELAKPKYNTGPVVSEIGDVLQRFIETMPGLTAPGAYFTGNDAITLNTRAFGGTSNRVLLHEVVHAATETMIRRDYTTLEPHQLAAIQSLYEMYNYAKANMPSGAYGLTNISEFVAEAFTNKKFQDQLRRIPYKNKKSLLDSFVRAVLRLFGQDNLASSVMLEANKLFSAERLAAAPVTAPRFAKRVRGPISTPTSYRAAEDVETSLSQVFKDATLGRMPVVTAVKLASSALWDASGGVYRAGLLPVLSLRQLMDLTYDKFPQIAAAVKIIEQMASYRGKLVKEVEVIAKAWKDAQSREPSKSRLMGRLMMEVTIRGVEVDPSGPGYDATKVNPALADAWTAIGPEFQNIYRRVRTFYTDAVNRMVRDMKERALGLPKAERQAMIKKINEQFGPGKLARPYFPLRRFGSFWFQIGNGNFKEFYMFESRMNRFLAARKRQDELSRGNATQKALANTLDTGNGISELYSRNIGTTQVLKDVHDLVDGLTATDVPGVKAEIQDSLNQLIYLLLPQQSVRKMFINRKGIQGASVDMLRVFAHSGVHSAYQQTRFKFSEAFLNNLSNAQTYVRTFASPERRAVYKDYIQEVEKRSKPILGLEEDRGWWRNTADNVTGFVFYYMLTAPASAIANTIGMAVIAMPYIGSRYGYAATNALMLKNTTRFAASVPTRTIVPTATMNFGQVGFPSIAEGGRLDMTLEKPAGVANTDWDDSLKRAAQQFIDDGDINISMTNDVFDISERPSDLYTGKANAVKRAAAAPFHMLERFNRENVLLTTFELAYKKFLMADKKDTRGITARDAQGTPTKYTPEEAFAAAVNEARNIAGMSLGDYVRQMKGRIFNYPGVNLVAQFKQYVIMTTYIVLRNHYLAVGAPFSKAEIGDFRKELEERFKNDPNKAQLIDQQIKEFEEYRKDVYSESRRRIAGIYGMAFLFGGLEALPFFFLLPMMLSLFGDDEDDDFFDWVNWFQNYMEMNVGGAIGATFAKMGADPKEAEAFGRKVGAAIQRGPVAGLTGASLTERVGINLQSLWYREGRNAPTARDTVKEEVIANAGPAVGMALNWTEAWDLASKGQYQRAMEKAVPVGVAAVLKMDRLSTEGATNIKGDTLGGLYQGELSTWELAMQGIGFQPERLAVAQKAAMQTKTRNEEILALRTRVLDRLYLDRGTEAYTDALKKEQEFNRKYPQVPITDEIRAESFQAKDKAKVEASAFGARVDEKLKGKLAPMMQYGMP
jgi:hypothetical protein